MDDDIVEIAQTMAACAAERALSKDWREHPMFGIVVDNDTWAVYYQITKARLEAKIKSKSGDKL